MPIILHFLQHDTLSGFSHAKNPVKTATSSTVVTAAFSASYFGQVRGKSSEHTPHTQLLFPGMQKRRISSAQLLVAVRARSFLPYCNTFFPADARISSALPAENRFILFFRIRRQISFT